MRGSWLVLLLAAYLVGTGMGRPVCADPPDDQGVKRLKEAEERAQKQPPPATPEEIKKLLQEPIGGTKDEREPGKRPKAEDAVAADEEVLKKASVATEGPALLDFFRKRSLPDAERAQVALLVRQLGADNYRQREHAAAELVDRGPMVSEVLRGALQEPDREIVRRVEKCLLRIQERDVSAEVLTAGVRLLALRKPAGSVDIMLAYVPFTDNDRLVEEIRDLVTSLALRAGKADPVLIAALTDRTPQRRALAAEALSKSAYADNKDRLRPLLRDPEALVRFRVAQALAHAQQRDAIPTLIDTIPDLPLNVAWQAEDFLMHVAEGRSPPAIAMGNDRPTREKCRDAWSAWWQKQGDKVELARLQETPKLLGRTLVVLLDMGRIQELGPDSQPRWQIDGLVFPLDVQVVSDERVLIAEYHANRVTERNLRGDIVWQKSITGPLMAQRLPNGNTFIATDSQFLEYDKNDREVLSVSMPDDQKRIMKAMKLPNGEIACITSDSRIVRFDTAGKELASFTVNLGTRLFGGRLHMLPSGRVLVPHNGEDKVVEYDARGKAIWEVAADKPVAAVRLPDGHTLITSMNPHTGAIEVDRAGNEVWSYRTTTRVTRALRR